MGNKSCRMSNLWHFDGDYYRVKVPTEKSYLEMSARKEIARKFDPTNVFMMWEKQGQLVPALGNEQWIIQSLDKKEWDTTYAFRPVLVPLGQDLCSIEHRFQEENPNGTIVTGGSVCFVDPSTGHPQIAGYVLPTMKSPTDVYVTDTAPFDKYVLEWVVWDGCLHCTSPICTCTANVLMQGKFLQVCY